MPAPLMSERAAAIDRCSIGLARFAAAPMSRKAAMAAVLALDAAVDTLRPEDEELLAFRARLAMEAPALGLVMALAAMEAEGPRLAIEAVELRPADYAALTEAEYMVSVYNGATVPRVTVQGPDSGQRDARALLDDALRQLMQRV